MDRDSIRSLSEAYNQVQSLEDKRNEEILLEFLGAAAAGVDGTLNYQELKKRGYTGTEAALKSALQTLAGMGGGALGGIGGAAIGGPAAPVTGFAGGVGGYYAGREGGGALYDKLTGRVNGRVPGSKATLGGKPVVWSKDGKWVPAGGEASTTPTAEPAAEPVSSSEAPPDTQQQKQAIADLQKGKDKTPVQTVSKLYQRQGQQQKDQQQATEPAATPEPEPTAAGTPTGMQQWAKKFPKLAAKIKPGQAGYDEIQAMKKPTQPAQTQPETKPQSEIEKLGSQAGKLAGDAVKGLNNNIVKPIVRKADQAIKNKKLPGLPNQTGDDMKKVTQESYTEAMNDAYIEMQILQELEATGYDYIYLDEGAGTAVRHLLKQAPKGWRYVQKAGRRMLERIKGKPAAKPNKPGMPGSGPGSKAQTKPGKPTNKPDVSKATDAIDDVRGAIKPGAKPTPKPSPKPPKASKPTKPGGGGRRAATAAAAGVAGTLAVQQYLKNRDGGSDSTSKPETESKPESKPTSEPGSSSNKPNNTSPQTTSNPRQRAKNRSSWNKPVGRREMRNANIARTMSRREEVEKDMLDAITDTLFEGLPEPKVNYLKDMDPYDPRRRLQQLAPGSPLPPADMRPGLPDMRLNRAKKDDKKKGKKTT